MKELRLAQFSLDANQPKSARCGFLDWIKGITSRLREATYSMRTTSNESFIIHLTDGITIFCDPPIIDGNLDRDVTILYSFGPENIEHIMTTTKTFLHICERLEFYILSSSTEPGRFNFNNIGVEIKNNTIKIFHNGRLFATDGINRASLLHSLRKIKCKIAP